MAEDDLRTFIREILRRNEVVWKKVLSELEQGRLALEGMQDELVGQRRAIADHHDETRAQTQALLRLLDRRSRGDD